MVSDEDVYIKKIEGEIRSHPRCNSLLEDKQYLVFLSRKIAKLIDINNNYVISPSQCTEFFSKLSDLNQAKELNKEIDRRKSLANDKFGQMNYERPMQNIIVQQVKLIDRTLSGLITGTNINLTDQNQANRLISNGTHQTTSFPVAYNNQHTLNPHGMMSSRKVEKRVQKRDPLGNPLWKSDGKP